MTPEDTKAIDRAELDVAVTRLKKYRIANPDQLDLVCAAAECWLATLPTPPKFKMMWGVSAGAELGWVHFDTYSAAIKALECEAWSGRRAVTIQHREVPV